MKNVGLFSKYHETYLSIITFLLSIFFVGFFHSPVVIGLLKSNRIGSETIWLLGRKAKPKVPELLTRPRAQLSGA
jgi:hypothetical protein